MPAYSICGHGAMIADAGRVNAFVTALRQKVRPGDTVLDIGTGIGIWAFVACRLGARKVYAVEPDQVVHVARKAAVANGFADRIEFVQDLSTRIELPEKVDGIVADIRGALPLFNGSLVTLLDAQERMLKPGGWIIPERDTLWAALVSDHKAYHDFVGLWDSRPLDLDLSAFRTTACAEWGRRRMTPDTVISAAAQWATIDYSTLAEQRVRGTASWCVDRPNVAHGLCVWFDMEAPGIGLSNSPCSDEDHVYSRTYFPWGHPVELVSGDSISVEIAADPLGDDYLWRWNTRVRSADGSERVHFEQSTFDSSHLSLERLRRRAHTHRPELNVDGEIDRMILDRFGNGSSLETIAREVAERFPVKFPTWQKALTRVATLSAQYSK